MLLVSPPRGQTNPSATRKPKSLPMPLGNPEIFKGGLLFNLAEIQLSNPMCLIYI